MRLSLGCWVVLGTGLLSVLSAAEEFRPVPLQARVTEVQPMTGIVLWSTNAAVKTAPIQLEFAYLTYDQVVRERDKYDWSAVEKLLDSIAGRKHQAVLRWHDTYVGKPNGMPAYIKSLPDYRGVTALSEKKPTGFPDWSHPELTKFVLDFFTQFAAKYDRDPRIAFVEVGFGLWAEYHIYDGPMQLGKTFPSREFQRDFAQHLGKQFRHTPWMISVDAARDHTPFARDKKLLSLPFGMFDDSFNHARHREVNEPNWNRLGRERWKIAPMGGEFSFYVPEDQKLALAPKGPHGVPFEDHARKFHITFMIGDGQPKYQPAARIREAGLACGYRFRVTHFATSATRSQVTIRNTGIAPIYYDAYPSVNRVRAAVSLRGLLPNESRKFEIASGGSKPRLTIECDRLVRGQRIEFDADLR